MKEALRLARAASRKTGAELAKLQERVTELDASLAVAPTSTRPAKAADASPPATADLAEERRRLRTKIDELLEVLDSRRR